MNARQIEVFRSIMQSGTLTGAARALNVSQPALSQILLHTEDQLGFKLFQRVAGRLVPTPEAEALFPEAERLHHDIAGFRRFATDLKRGKAGTARLAASAPPALSFVPTALHGFRQAHPGVRLLSYVVPAEVIAQMLDRGEADLGLAMNDRARPGTEAETIAHTEVVCVMGAGNRLAAQDHVTVADLAEESLITYRAESLPGTLLHQAFAREGAHLRPSVEIDVSIIALAFVQQGFGVALVDGLLPWTGFAGLEMRPFRPQVALPISLLGSTRRPVSIMQRALRQHLRDAVQDYAASPAARGLLRAVPLASP
jgi:DNA-binding transcriptional LysR family regulator